MSPRSRGRPPGRGRRRKPGSGPAARSGSPRPASWSGDEPALLGEETDCWFDDPDPADRQSWAIPPGHGTYRGIDLELLDPGDDDELMILIEARHEDYHDALETDQDVTVGGETVNPRLHVAMHHVVAKQVLADDPPQTWQTVQRLAGLGYDWHDVTHMIAALVAEDVYAVMSEHRKPDPAAYLRRLDQLPGDWPLPGTSR